MITLNTATVREFAGIYLRGFCMGAADAVPGVSGGTIALILGIYERLISAVTAIDPAQLPLLVEGLRSEGRSEAVDVLREIDAGFLFALGAGIITAVLSVLRLISVLLARHPVETYGFFFGLIGASAVVLASEVSLETRGQKAAAASGFLFAFAVSGYVATAAASTLPLVFLAGVVAISAMILPGVSGSLLLVLLGQYEYMSRTLSAFTDALVNAIRGGGTAGIVDSGLPVGVFLCGAVVGLFTVAHAVRLALDQYRKATVTFLVSLIVGALRAPVEQVQLERTAAGSVWTLETLALFVGFAVVGAAVVGGLDRLAGEITLTPAA